MLEELVPRLMSCNLDILEFEDFLQQVVLVVVHLMRIFIRLSVDESILGDFDGGVGDHEQELLKDALFFLFGFGVRCEDSGTAFTHIHLSIDCILYQVL